MKLTFETKDGKVVPMADGGGRLENVQKCTVTSGDDGTIMTVTVRVE